MAVFPDKTLDLDQADEPPGRCSAQMTPERLDALCGGPPTVLASCPHCSRQWGPYYSAALAHDAIADHIAWRHGTRAMVGEGTSDRVRRPS